MTNLQRLTVNGRPATVAFMADLMGPLVSAADATVAVVNFDDGQHAFYFLKGEPKALGEAAGHEFHGNQWTEGKGDVSEVGQPIGYRAEVNRLQTAMMQDGGITATRVQFPEYADGTQVEPGAVAYPMSPDQRGRVKARIVADLSVRVSEKLPLPFIPERFKLDEGTQRYLDPMTGEEYAEEDAYAEEIQKRLDLWSDTSGDHNPRAIAMQTATQEELGLDEAATEHLRYLNFYKPDAEKVKLQLTPTKFDRAYVRAEYEATQEWLKKNQIETVTVFRGVGGSAGPTGPSRVVNMQPASSWTVDLATAVDFAEAAGFEGRVLMTRVPRSRVLSTAVTGRGSLLEHEVLLTGGKLNARVFSTRGEEWDETYSTRQTMDTIRRSLK